MNIEIVMENGDLFTIKKIENDRVEIVKTNPEGDEIDMIIHDKNVLVFS